MEKHLQPRQKGSKNKTPLEKLAENPTSLRAAVNAKCYQCQGEDADPSVQWRIGNCEIPDCGLWEIRPYLGLEGKPVPKGLKV